MRKNIKEKKLQNLWSRAFDLQYKFYTTLICIQELDDKSFKEVIKKLNFRNRRIHVNATM